MDAARRFNQLCGDPDTASGPTDTTLQNISYTELAPDLGDTHRLVAEGKGGVPGNHEKGSEARETGDDVIREPLGKILLFGIVA